MARSDSPKKVFISYAREDISLARRLYTDLKRAGAEPWLDTEILLPGQKWKSEISKAIRQCDIFLALLSSRSIGKRGYVQRELKEAMEIFDEIPESEIYLIPVRLDECRPAHPKLLEISWVDLFPVYESGFRNILRVVRPSSAVSSGSLFSARIEDPDDLAQTGWAAIFPADCDPRVIEALSPLLQHRKAQASQHYGHFYREFSGVAGYRQGDSKTVFLARHGAGPGPADPHRVPYYLLVVGTPEEIPFQFQSQLGIQYRVGRLHFDAYEEYHNYAKSVVDTEVGNSESKPKSSVFFGVENNDDLPTKLAVERLVQPLAETVKVLYRDWEVHTLLRERASKSNLLKILTDSCPTLLFIVAHGLVFKPDNDRHATDQGSIVCHEWPGPGNRVEAGHYFSAADVPEKADMRGSIIFHFGDYSAGVFPQHGQSGYSFVAPLAKRLLGKPNGAMGLIGHLNTVSALSFQWSSTGPQLQTFEWALRSILGGSRIGLALGYFQQRYAELSVAASEAEGADRRTLSRAATDARDYIVIGDPAAKPIRNGAGGA